MKRLLKLSFVPLALIAVLAVSLVGTLLIRRDAGAAPASTCTWQVVSSPNVGLQSDNQLNSVAAVSAKDVWSVGYVRKPDRLIAPLAEHWNGTQWSVIAMPNLHLGSIFLDSVSADAPNDVWAVGASQRVRASSNTLIEHWDGTQWSQVSSPNTGSNDVLYGVTAIAPDNAWAVGDYDNGDDVLIEHWNGTQWSIVPGANPGNVNNSFSGVTAISANDIWAVGYTSSSSNIYEQTLTEHWDGTQWSVVNSPNVPKTGNFLLSVSASATNNVWAVGYLVSNQQTLIEHWNGTKWSLVPGIPAHSGSYVQFNSVVALSTNNVWAVGYAGFEQQTLIGRWNGTKLNQVSSPSPGAQSNNLRGITRVSGSNQLWAVGFAWSGSNGLRTLIESYC